MLSYTLKVIDVKKETEDAYTYSFKQPALKKVKYLPGQYLTVVFRINGRRYLRPYSFSSTPQIDSTLNITVKRMNGGIVSNHIIDKVHIGDIVEVLEPMGDFVLPEGADLVDKHLVLWCSGSGITPLLSIAKHVLKNNLIALVTLIYGNRSPDSTIFSDEIKRMQMDHADHFSVIHFYSQAVFDQSSPYLIQGRIDPQAVMELLGKELDLINTLHYICGPMGLKESIKDTLALIGVDEQNVFTEDFEITRNPKDFENVFTQSVIIKIKDHPQAVEVAKGKSILEAGLDAMLELSYSCQTGDCLLCKGTLLNGEVKMIGAKKAAMLNQNECLLCCSFPLTENVSINIE
jgi:ring-1,2-phenylacetyl-CoA epoxidase subunit PaaE